VYIFPRVSFNSQ